MIKGFRAFWVRESWVTVRGGGRTKLAQVPDGMHGDNPDRIAAVRDRSNTHATIRAAPMFRDGELGLRLYLDRARREP